MPHTSLREPAPTAYLSFTRHKLLSTSAPCPMPNAPLFTQHSALAQRPAIADVTQLVLSHVVIKL